MEKKVKIINIERNEEGIILFRNRAKLSSFIELHESHIYYPDILTRLDTSGAHMIAVDIHLPCNIAAFVAELKKITTAKIIITCEFVQPDLIFNCLRSGAVGYVEKFCGKNKFEHVVTDCMDNMISLPLSIMGLYYAKNIMHEADSTFKNIFSLLSRGFLLHDVTRQTGLSEQEIKQHLFLSLQR